MIDSITLRSAARDFLDRAAPHDLDDYDDAVGYLARFGKRLVDDELEPLLETAREDATTKTDEEVRIELLDEVEERFDKIAKAVDVVENFLEPGFKTGLRREINNLNQCIDEMRLWIKKERP